MSPIVAAVVLQLLTSAFSANVTEDASNKTKRTVADQVQNFAESRPVLYNDAQTGLTGFYDPVKPAFEPDLSKQVAAQQVLYEFQQTPTNAVSNVHVNQYYQPLQKEQYGGENAGPAQFGATIATPVQHGAVIRHGGPNYQQYHPAPPQHIQTHQYIPGKLFYVNGKIVYPPGQNYQKQAYNPYYQKQGYNPYNQQRVVTPTYRPVMYTKFTPPQPQQLQKITKPMYSPEVVEEQKEEQKPAEEDENAEEVEEKEESEDKASLEEEDDDEDQHFSKYTSFDDDDDDHDHSAYRHYEDEDEDDNERGSSRTVPKKHSKKPQKYTKSNNYKYSENYSSSSKYDKPMKKAKKGGKSPKMHYKSVKYSKRSHAKPRIDSFEGKQSQNIPVIHKQKIFKEKWYVTKSTDDSITQ